MGKLAWDVEPSAFESVETLRILIQQMLLESAVSPSDLMRAWDRSGDKTLDKREFVANCKRLFKFEPQVTDTRVSTYLPGTPRIVHMHLNESLASPFSFPPAHPLPLPCSYGRQSCIGLRIMPSTSSKTTGKEAEWKLTRLKEG